VEPPICGNPCNPWLHHSIGNRWSVGRWSATRGCWALGVRHWLFIQSVEIRVIGGTTFCEGLRVKSAEICGKSFLAFGFEHRESSKCSIFMGEHTTVIGGSSSPIHFIRMCSIVSISFWCSFLLLISTSSFQISKEGETLNCIEITYVGPRFRPIPSLNLCKSASVQSSRVNYRLSGSYLHHIDVDTGSYLLIQKYFDRVLSDSKNYDSEYFIVKRVGLRNSVVPMLKAQKQFIELASILGSERPADTESIVSELNRLASVNR